jgi:hypothetical protein
MSSAVGVIAAFSKPESAELAKHVTEHLRSRGVPVIEENELPGAKPDLLKAIIVLGGDG